MVFCDKVEFLDQVSSYQLLREDSVSQM